MEESISSTKVVEILCQLGYSVHSRSEGLVALESNRIVGGYHPVVIVDERAGQLPLNELLEDFDQQDSTLRAVFLAQLDATP